ncbi:MAG TPA: Rieske (2Fe-2S) protein [Vicinamibacteria bacterium]|nr:Rieske (2Fe-2S) protein [Vicinamibacteria bacterium]
MAEAPRSRRSALQALILSLLGGAALWRFLTPRAGAGASARGAVSLPEADVPPEGALVLPQQRVALVREGGDFLAFDLTCPHLGCTVKATEQGFSCPCHGSRFGRGGDVLKGPAPRALKRLALARRDGIIRVERG